MHRRLAAALVSLGAVLALAGCGAAGDSSAADVAVDPSATTSGDTPTSAPAAGSGAVEPSWPATGCESRASSAIDYAREPQGWKTPEEAVAHAPNLDLPDGVLMLAPAEPHEPMSVYVVDPASNTILAAVSVFPGGTGFFVDGVTTCA